MVDSDRGRVDSWETGGLKARVDKQDTYHNEENGRREREYYTDDQTDNTTLSSVMTGGMSILFSIR